MQRREGFRIISVGILCLLAQGCVGVATLRTKTETLADPKLYDAAGSHNVLPHDSPGVTNTAGYTAAWLETRWGKPTSVSRVASEGRDEVWTYKFGSLWNGVIVGIVVPVPLILPVGRERVEFSLLGGRVVSAKQVRVNSATAAAGLLPGICGFRFGATVERN